ncbi:MULTISPECIES: type VI secretion system-associated FHA domain protein TagH [Pseudomonas]|uniref:Type VI secretion system-associated FHA domain protein TagH n=1 Tax=Pseudomonas azadiae TaxID=2843612 RepID=A0ABS6P5N2_9PSED|nr:MULTISPECIES: type VI secretion system-associated FHA domain protein TagH [Pseudomonas]MBV4455336.1 type VI secretion system-associated FHA domain protein TagH [Pseudomonas azadiae]NMF43665.1 type VI secretion system-associated FHA domain protein TagH [Pseudomonas sp. SWRI 103]
MQLTFEVCSTASGEPPARKTFDGVGGVIGRGTGCDWIIPDADRSISSHHGLIVYREGHYFLTDISSNGIGVSGSMERLCKGQARLIGDGDVYQMGRLNIRASLVVQERQPFAREDMIPDDAFLGLDPVCALEREHMGGDLPAALGALDTSTQALPPSLCQGPVDRDHLVAPKWAEPAREILACEPTTAAPAGETFWPRFARALGMPLDTLDTPAREALAIKVAGLFKLTLEGLQQSLRTRDELHSELNEGLTAPESVTSNPLKDCADSHAAMAALLGANESRQLCAEQAVTQVCRDLQIHQLALVVASRATIRGALTAFAPAHLLLCFEREGKPPRFFSEGAHWRAYQRHYRRLTEEEPLGEQLLLRDFSKAYEEQVRLVSTLHVGHPG